MHFGYDQLLQTIKDLMCSISDMKTVNNYHVLVTDSCTQTLAVLQLENVTLKTVISGN